MDRALSIEMGEILDAHKAHELYAANIIFDKRGFECPGNNCNAQITCVNIEKLVHDMKQGVHFRVIGNHEPTCSLENQELNANRIKLNTDGKQNSHKDETVDNFILTRPENYYDKKVQIDSLNSNAKNEYKRKLNKELDLIERASNHYCINPLVSHFINASDRSKIQVSIKGFQISYSDFFADITETSFNDIPEYDKVYYQLAYINSTKDKNNIQIRFKNGFVVNQIISTSFLIGIDLIKNYKTPFWERKFNKLIDSGKPVWVYIYGRPFISLNKKYINFSCKNLDFIEILSNNPN